MTRARLTRAPRGLSSAAWVDRGSTPEISGLPTLQIRLERASVSGCYFLLYTLSTFGFLSRNATQTSPRHRCRLIGAHRTLPVPRRRSRCGRVRGSRRGRRSMELRRGPWSVRRLVRGQWEVRRARAGRARCATDAAVAHVRLAAHERPYDADGVSGASISLRHCTNQNVGRKGSER